MTSDDEKILDEIKKLCFSYKRNSYYSSSVKSVMDKIMAPFNKLSSKGKTYAIYFLALNFVILVKLIHHITNMMRIYFYKN